MQVIAALIAGLVLAVALSVGVVGLQESRSAHSVGNELRNYGDR